MADPYVRTVGEIDGLTVGVDYDSVVVFGYPLTASQAEDFARLFVSAVWQAGQQRGRMDAEDDA